MEPVEDEKAETEGMHTMLEFLLLNYRDCNYY